MYLNKDYASIIPSILGQLMSIELAKKKKKLTNIEERQ